MKGLNVIVMLLVCTELMGRIGYGNYAINGYYSLVDILVKEKGRELIPYSVGISFTF